MNDSIFNQIKQPDIHFYGNPEISFLHKKKEKRYLHSSQRYIPISKYELTESGDITFCVSDCFPAYLHDETFRQCPDDVP